MSDSDDLDELRESLRATREAAERLAGRVPPQGWAAVSEEARSETAAELQALVGVLHALRDVVPDELWDHVRELARQLLVFLRALLDLVVERLSADRAGKRPRAAGPDLQDIPIT